MGINPSSFRALAICYLMEVRKRLSMETGSSITAGFLAAVGQRMDES